MIPPGLSEYDYVNHCPSTCTDRVLPPEGVQIINSRLHMHYHAKAGAAEVSQRASAHAEVSCRNVGSERVVC